NGNISPKGIVNALMDILGAIIAYKTISGVVGAVSAFSKGFGSLIGLITAHPVVAAIAGITALTIGIIALSEEMERQRIASHFGDISISLDEIRELVDPITEDVNNVADAFDDNKTKLETAKDNFADIAKAVQETADSFKKNDIEQDVAGFAQQLDEFVNSALEVNAATFDTSAIKSAFSMDGVIDEEEQAILDQLGDLGGSVADTIRSYGEEIHKITQAAIDENRELTEAEIANLESLYKKLADLTAEQENIKTAATWERLKNGDYTYDSYAEVAEQIKAAQEQAEKSREAIEQSNYEAIMEMVAMAETNGTSAEDLEKLKQNEIAKLKENLEASRIEDKRYERDVLLAWVEGASKNLLEAADVDAEMMEKVKEALEMMLMAPAGTSSDDFMSQFQISEQDLPAFNIARLKILEPMKEMGFDVLREMNELNEEIGEGIYSFDEFSDKYADLVEKFAPFDIDDIMPTLQEFRDRPDEYAEVWNKWLELQNWCVRIGVEFDGSKAEEEWDKFLIGERSKLQTSFPTPSSYTAQPSAAEGEMRLDIHVYSDETETARNMAMVKAGRATKETVDLYANNGKGRS
ncbi:MAG: hypothetical protein NC299_18625, partial [Lachnospiraceae bacterium]|nr:hypothetical protein [Lachnospiraceae bacterium]